MTRRGITATQIFATVFLCSLLDFAIVLYALHLGYDGVVAASGVASITGLGGAGVGWKLKDILGK